MRGIGGYRPAGPPPEVPGFEGGFDIIEPDPEPDDPGPDIPAWVNPPPGSYLDDEIPPDPEPGHLRAIPAADRKDRPRGKAGRVTAATRKDIEAKVGLMIEIPGRMWQARDPWCGGAFVQAAPEIRPALADLICQSPDLVAWFTGAGGGFMLWANLMVACQPVLMMMWAHHIAHSIGRRDADGNPIEPAPQTAYAA